MCFLEKSVKENRYHADTGFFVITVGMVVLGYITANMHSMGKPASRKVRKKGFCENQG